MYRFVIIFLLSGVCGFAQPQNGEELLQAMYTKYGGKYCQTVTFDQRTIRYDTSGRVTDTTFWYEWISYPDKFRIDFGKKHAGNCVIFRNDSVFNFRNHKPMRHGTDENDLLLLLGGMYHRPFDTVVARFERLGYDLDKLTLIDANSKWYYVISSNTNSKDAQHQMWVDKKDLKVVKIVTMLNENDKLEIQFDEFKKTCKGFTETKVSAYKNGKLEQKEEYLNLKTSVAIPDSIFYKH